ncbi:RSM22 [[Candida] subhashii]|uniref:RSM22 n=1 Tax=[Candida] subhashii TaxID=561895 RepID=A0A8J5QMB4_9ASCO|nr:RSM22 [[Candida] subhashii]KAG7661090.1 RSM22 [[Candida] subhashii]
MYRRSIIRSNITSVLLRNSKYCYSTTNGSSKNDFNFDFMTQEEERTPNPLLPFQKDLGSVVIPEDMKPKKQKLSAEEKEARKQAIREKAVMPSSSPFRNEDGTFIKGHNSQDARLHDSTLLGKVDNHITVLPRAIAKAIGNNILSTNTPGRLRQKVVSIYQNMQKAQIQKDPSTPLDTNAHIAAFFLQDYSHCRQVLLELQKRVGKDKFNPQSVLDVGYGPATGMVALNEIMGDEWVPKDKDAYIVGRRNGEMKKRAKIILSRQINENFAGEQPSEPSKKALKRAARAAAAKAQEIAENGEEVVEVGQEQEETVQEETAQEEQVEEEDEYVGPVNTKKINIRTVFRSTIPMTKQYDLIIVNNSLLSREFSFPRDVDENIRTILRCLAPGGHLVLVERGNSVGFETIARARQIMIRPENFPDEIGKIPRPYIKGSRGKPQRMKKEDAIITEDDIKFEEEMLAKMEQEGQEMAEELKKKFGDVAEEELKFDHEEEMEVFDVDTPIEEMLDRVDYHLSIVAPCPHHRKCPLQLGDPKYYKISSHKRRLNFCSFSKVVERPKYTMELKRGKLLASTWDKSAEDGIGKLTKAQLKKMEGSGRAGGRDSEDGSYSYLIVNRSLNDNATLEKIEKDREFKDRDDFTDINHWPRIIENPQKKKSNVTMKVCSAEGNVELWQVPKSFGKQEYHDARKASRGDLWALGKKSHVVKNTLSDEAREKLDKLYITQKKNVLKEQQKKRWKKVLSVNEETFNDEIADVMATNLENSRKYKALNKKLPFDVDPESFDGN